MIRQTYAHHTGYTQPVFLCPKTYAAGCAISTHTEEGHIILEYTHAAPALIQSGNAYIPWIRADESDFCAIPHQVSAVRLRIQRKPALATLTVHPLTQQTLETSHAGN